MPYIHFGCIEKLIFPKFEYDLIDGLICLLSFIAKLILLVSVLMINMSHTFILWIYSLKKVISAKSSLEVILRLDAPEPMEEFDANYYLLFY